VHVASDVVSGEEIKRIVEDITGKKKYRFKIYPWMLRLVGNQFYRQMQWNKAKPWQFGLEETRQIYPYLTSFKSFVEKLKEKI
jgi:hypothetical protein